MLKLMYIVFTYGDNYVGKQASSNCVTKPDVT